jgi:hypothetical protein
MWRRVGLVWTDVSEERIASILRVEKSASWAGSSLADFSTLKMEAILSSETSVHARSTRRHIPEDCILHNHRRENLKSYKMLVFERSETTLYMERQLWSFLVYLWSWNPTELPTLSKYLPFILICLLFVTGKWSECETHGAEFLVCGDNVS